MENQKIQEIFAARIKDAALKAGYKTQTALSEELGLSPQVVNYYFKAKNMPDAYTLAKIAAALGVSCDYLLGLSDVSAIDKDINRAAKTTGLSSDAVKALKLITDLERSYSQFKVTHIALMLDDILENLLTDIEACRNDLLGSDYLITAIPALENSVLGVLYDLYRLEKNNAVGAAITINGETVSADNAHDIITIMHYNKLSDALVDLLEGDAE